MRVTNSTVQYLRKAPDLGSQDLNTSTLTMKPSSLQSTGLKSHTFTSNLNCFHHFSFQSLGNIIDKALFPYVLLIILYVLRFERCAVSSHISKNELEVEGEQETTFYYIRKKNTEIIIKLKGTKINMDIRLAIEQSAYETLCKIVILNFETALIFSFCPSSKSPPIINLNQ